MGLLHVEIYAVAPWIGVSSPNVTATVSPDHILQALLMYRIPNIVVPPRMPDTPRHPSRNSPFRRFIDNILPLDMSRTTTRFALHLPTLYFLIRILLLWCILVLQTSNLYPSHESGVIFELGKWCETKTMKEINSATFSTISAAFCVEGLVQSLGGVGSAFGAHMHANTSPFNLVWIPSFLFYDDKLTCS